MVYKFFDKKSRTSGRSGLATERDYQIANELHR